MLGTKHIYGGTVAKIFYINATEFSKLFEMSVFQVRHMPFFEKIGDKTGRSPDGKLREILAYRIADDKFQIIGLEYA